MNCVFIGGSRKIARLAEPVRKRLDSIIAGNFTVLVGDANGSDKAVQQFLADHAYSKVIVYCMNGNLRNNLGGWSVNPIQATGGAKGFDYYSLKDKAMAEAADYGFMLWDGMSKGTLNNVVNLISDKKKCLVYLADEATFHTIRTMREIRELTAKCAGSTSDKLLDFILTRNQSRHSQLTIPIGR